MNQTATKVIQPAPAAADAPDWRMTLVRGLERAVEWMLLAILVVLPLDAYLVLPPSTSGVFLSEVLTAEASALLGFALLVARLLRVSAALRLRWWDAIPLGLVVAAGVLSLPHAASHGTTIKECLKYAVYLGIYLLARACWSRPGVRIRALVALWLSFAVVVAAGLLGPVIGLPDFLGPLLNIQRTPAAIPYSTVMRAESTFRYPNELAIYLLVTLPIILASALRIPWRAERNALWVLAVLGIGVLFLTYTRGALIALVLALPLMLFLIGGRRLGIVGALLVLAGAGVLVLRGGATASHLLSALSPTSSAYSERFAAWRWALSSFAHSPLFGVGAGNIGLQPNAPWINQAAGLREANAENLYLNVLAELGVVGLGAVLYCFGGALRRAWQSYRRGGDWADQAWNIGLLSALVALVIYGVVDPVLLSAQDVGTLCALVGLSGSRWVSSRQGLASRGVADFAVPTLLPRPNPQAEGAHAAFSPHVGRRLAQQLTTRVVFLINAPRYGGAEMHAFNLARETHRAGGRVLIVCPPGSPLLAEAAREGIPCRALDLGLNLGRMKGVLGTLAYFNPLSRRRTARIVEQLAGEEPTTFVCPFPREQLLVTALRDRLWYSVIWIIHSPLYYLPHTLLVARRWARLARQADALATVTPWMATRLRANDFPIGRLEILPNAVPTPMVVPESSTERVPDLLVVIARITRGKGIQYLIEALPSILRARPHARLVIAGSGPYARALQRQVALLGFTEYVEFVGYLAHPDVLLRQASVMVMPSCDRGEVLPTVVLEASAAGVPLVASNIAAMPEIVRDRQTGLLVRPGDARGLATAVVALLEQPEAAQTMGAAGRDLVRARYTFATVGVSFLQMVGQAEEGFADPEASRVHLAALREQSSTEMRRLMRPRLVNNTALFTASKVLTALATAVWTILAARTLAPASYGDLMLCASLVELGAIVTDAGFTTAATRQLAQPQTEHDFRLLAGMLFWVKFVLGLIAVVVTIAVSFLLPFGGDVRLLMLVMGPSLVFTAFNSLSLVFRARLQLPPVVSISAVVSVATIAGALTATAVTANSAAFALVRLLAVVFGGSLMVVLVTRRFLPLLVSRDALERKAARRLLRTLSGTAIMLGLALMLNILYVRIDVVLVALLAGDTQVAIYSSAYRIIDLVSLVPVSAAGVALPLLAALGTRRLDHVRHFMQQYLDLAVAIGLFTGLVLTLIGDPLLGLLYGNRYAASGPVLHVLAWAGAAMFVTNVFMPLAVAFDRRAVLLSVSLLGLEANVGLNVLLIPRVGPVGAAWATLLTELAVTLPTAWMTIRTLRWRIDPYTILAAVEATAAALLSTVLFAPLPGWLLDVLVVLVWCGALFVLAPRWVLALVRSLRTRQLPAAEQHSGSDPAVLPQEPVVAAADKGR